MGFYFSKETTETKIFSFRKFEFGAQLDAVQLALDCRIARAMAAVPNSIIFLDLVQSAGRVFRRKESELGFPFCGDSISSVRRDTAASTFSFL